MSIEILYIRLRLPNDDFLVTSTERAIALDVLQQIGSIEDLSPDERTELANDCLAEALEQRTKLMADINSRIM